jgi:hypothetical protein
MGLARTNGVIDANWMARVKRVVIIVTIATWMIMD